MDTPTPPPSQYLDPYREALDRFGTTFDATLWRSRQTQTVRFGVLIEMVDLNGLRLLDAGCALGDLAVYLEQHDIHPSRFIGIDGLPEIIDKANARGIANAEFHAVDFVADSSVWATHDADVIFFSGSLNTFAEDQARDVIDAAYSAANTGLVFNFLSDRCDRSLLATDTGPASRFNTLAWLDWAFTKTPIVRFRQDYLRGHDATIGMFK